MQSRVHNFYLELTPQQTWKWHWFVTEAASDARLMAKLVVTPQPDPTPAQSTSRQGEITCSGTWIPSFINPLGGVLKLTCKAKRVCPFLLVRYGRMSQ